MTMISDKDETRAKQMLTRVLAAFDTAQEVLERTVERLRAEEKVSGTDLTKDLREMNNAFLMALSWEEKTRAAAGKGQGGVGQGALDLNAARAEIGIRLACLRTAGGCGTVSDGAE